jgi:hypothetical protein
MRDVNLAARARDGRTKESEKPWSREEDAPEGTSHRRAGWLGRLDSNQGMAESKSSIPTMSNIEKQPINQGDSCRAWRRERGRHCHQFAMIFKRF